MNRWLATLALSAALALSGAAATQDGSGPTRVFQPPPVTNAALNGTWQGIAVQPGGPFKGNYTFTLEIKVEQGRITGFSRREIPDSQFFGVMELVGEEKPGGLGFRDVKILKENHWKGYCWCLIRAQLLTYDAAEDSLSGKWDGTSTCGSCAPGFLKVYRTKVKLDQVKAQSKEQLAFEAIQQPDVRSIVGKKVLLDRIHFDINTPVLRSESLVRIKELATFLRTNPSLRIRIMGHTDNTGDGVASLQLSRNRARAVGDALIQLGIDAERVIFEGYGMTRPIDTNATTAGREKNRRVEFEVLD